MANKDRHDRLLTIDELAARSALHLSEVDQASGRVSEVPSRRTIRYYAQHGLLDKPVKFEGRTALYGARHVMQLVAIKRLQARGETLSDIQSRVTGANDQKLAKLAELDTLDGSAKQAESSRSEDFWATPPAEPTPAGQQSQTSHPVSGLRLDDDVLLVLEGLRRELREDDAKAIAIAAEPLLKVLQRRHLLNPRSEEGPQNE